MRHPPDGGCLGVAPRAVLSPSRLSRRLSSRLETVRYAGDPGPSTSNPGSQCHVGSPRGERRTRASETRCFLSCSLESLRSFVLVCSCSAVRCGWLVLMRITIDHVCPSVSMASVVTCLFPLIEFDNLMKLGGEPGVVKAIYCIFWR